MIDDAPRGLPRRAEAYSGAPWARLRDEIQAAAANTNKRGVTVRHAEIVIEAVRQLRQDLAREQAQR